MKTEHKLVDTAKAMLRENHDNENPHIKSRENEAHNLKTLLKVSENNKLNPKLVDGKIKKDKNAIFFLLSTLLLDFPSSSARLWKLALLLLLPLTH